MGRLNGFSPYPHLRPSSRSLPSLSSLPEVGQNHKDRLCTVKPRSSRDIVYCLKFHRVHTEWQRPRSGVHSILIEKSALAGEGGGFTPTPFHSIYHHGQSCWCTLQLKWQIHSFYFYSIPLYVLYVPDFSIEKITLGR